MKLGYLSIPPDAVGIGDFSGLDTSADAPPARGTLAQELGFTEFYSTVPCQTLAGLPAGPELQQSLHILGTLPAPLVPYLIAVNGAVTTDALPRPECLTAPAQTAAQVQALSGAGYAPLSVSWLDTDMLARHWTAHVTGCTHAARIARPQDWRVARTVIACQDPDRAEAAAKDPNSPCRAYYRNTAPKGADDAAVDALIDACVLYGTPATIMDRLHQITDDLVTFGTLVMVDHAWPDRALARQSMTMFAGAVLPTYQTRQRHKTRKMENA